MLDYEHFSPAQDLDAELRFAYIHLQSLGGTDNPIRGQANAENLSLMFGRNTDGYSIGLAASF